jgi:hypothetical protein
MDYISLIDFDTNSFKADCAKEKSKQNAEEKFKDACAKNKAKQHAENYMLKCRNIDKLKAENMALRMKYEAMEKDKDFKYNQLMTVTMEMEHKLNAAQNENSSKDSEVKLFNRPHRHDNFRIHKTCDLFKKFNLLIGFRNQFMEYHGHRPGPFAFVVCEWKTLAEYQFSKLLKKSHEFLMLVKPMRFVYKTKVCHEDGTYNKDRSQFIFIIASDFRNCFYYENQQKIGNSTDITIKMKSEVRHIERLMQSFIKLLDTK